VASIPLTPLPALREVKAARSTGNPEIFYAFFIEKFVTVKANKILSEGQEGVRGMPKRKPGVPPATYYSVFLDK